MFLSLKLQLSLGWNIPLLAPYRFHILGWLFLHSPSRLPRANHFQAEPIRLLWRPTQNTASHPPPQGSSHSVWRCSTTASQHMSSFQHLALSGPSRPVPAPPPWLTAQKTVISVASHSSPKWCHHQFSQPAFQKSCNKAKLTYVHTAQPIHSHIH